ncbi:c-type cytochrome [Thaumasiovibrio subtropicus]|uniref:c-type cytochrome n=1 Tax=Thaumasiovibrio subtropicus TaxID=1891207 RepID=UPI000B34B55C|nr:cytochrome c5 family protein [Thaumasiovibrio subtropicus]
METSLRKLMTAAAAALIFSTSAMAANMSDDAIAERIKPVGSVYLEGDAPVEVVNSGPRSGEKVYGTFCIACHGAGVAGAPKVNDKAAWEPRLAAGMDMVTQNAIQGFNAMPAKGTCMDCSDEEIVAAINHMVADIVQ